MAEFVVAASADASAANPMLHVLIASSLCFMLRASGPLLPVRLARRHRNPCCYNLLDLSNIALLNLKRVVAEGEQRDASSGEVFEDCGLNIKPLGPLVTRCGGRESLHTG